MRPIQYIAFLFLSLLWCPSIALAVDILPGGGEPVVAQVVVPDDLSPNDVGEFVAPLAENEVRNLLIDNLRSDALAGQAIAQQPSASVIELLKGIGNTNTPLGGGLNQLVESASTYLPTVSKIINELSDGAGYPGFLKLILIFLTIVVAALLIEYFIMRRWYNKQLPVAGASSSHSVKSLFKQPLIFLFAHIVGLVIFAVASYVIAHQFLPEDSNSFKTLTRFIDIAIKFKFLVILFRFLMSAPPKGLDLIDDRISKTMVERSFLAFLFFYYIVFHGFAVTLLLNGLSPIHFQLSAVFAFGLLINPLVIGGVWLARNDIDRVLFGSLGQVDTNNNPYKHAARARVWPTAVTVSLLLVFFLWQIMSLTGVDNHRESLEQAWWLIIVFPWVDLIVSSLLNKLTNLPVFQNSSFQKRKARFVSVIRNVLRIVMITVLLLKIVDSLNLPVISQISAFEKDFGEILVDIGVIILVGFIVWEIVQFWIEQKLPDEPDEDMVEREEGAGAAATRTETLLPLLRTTMLIVLFIVVVMLVLNTLGVEIGPLLAGAGVVGIAIGFGSQKLVQDILSGVFFLVDDAFRKGEYIVLADMGGTVEKLSVRSMQLRHHRGAVQTIPYGEIQTVKNHSRDWVTMKLELRLAYDVDIEKVRKIIKKIGKEMTQDPEYGHHILSPLKSQGVLRVEDSALIVRMKFTAKPGEQWVIRRQAYTRVRDALSAEGIEFARREVKVRLPEELENLQIKDLENKLQPGGAGNGNGDGDNGPESKDGSTAAAALAAAAVSAVIAQELEDGETGDGPVDDR